MATNTYEFTIRLSNGSTQKIQIQANTPGNARLMVEAQYGKGSIAAGPIQLR